MLSQRQREFLAANHRGVLTTFRASGAAQMSIVSCGQYKDGAALTVTADRAKLKNLRRDPRCSLLVAMENWRAYLVLEGRARLLSPENTDPEELRIALREVYRAAAGKEHPDWRDYDRAMVEQRRSAVLVMPEHVYGWNV